MIAALTLAGAVALAPATTTLRAWYIQGNAARTQATYRIEYRQSSPGHENSYDNEWPVALDALGKTFPGLTIDQLYSSGTHVQFESRRDAGTIDQDGWAAQGNASGNFTISLSQPFVRELQRRGVGTPTAEQQERMAIADAGYAELDALDRYGYARPSIDDFLRLVDHGVTATYIREMHDAGFTPHTTDEIVRAEDHGVTPAFTAGLRAHGVTGSLDDFIRARDHGVDVAEASGFAALGFKGLSLEQLIKLRDHGVDVSYATHLRERGYTNLSIDDLIKLRDHGV